MVLGELSGERDGKEVRDFSDGGVCVVELLDTYRLGLTRTVPDLWLLVEAVEAWEEVRSSCPLLLSSIANGYHLLIWHIEPSLKLTKFMISRSDLVNLIRAGGLLFCTCSSRDVGRCLFQVFVGGDHVMDG